ncbi:hypothetical protein HanOQP8_Chr16g0611191 [Helianthus annuus]|nr:hypothetical protein HanLR1_Chr16g0615271 [Helianthus annuus]KAJ0644362.1 hypothetical protein HanOQP8_Chr16g0611191 [Helianthus annuus]
MINLLSAAFILVKRSEICTELVRDARFRSKNVASVEYREEDVSSGEINEKENGDDVSLFVDFVQKSNRIQVTLGFSKFKLCII